MRRGFGLLAIAWLNLVLTPCALAIGGEHDCPHGPSSGHQEMAGHGEHMAEHMAEHLAEHPCASMQDACCEVPDASVDMRAGTVKFGDSPEVVGITAPVASELAGQPRAHILPTADPPDPPDELRALHKLFCVYLK
jgi:hypothetical protein